MSGEQENPQPVKIVAVDIPIWDMMGFIFRLAFALVLVGAIVGGTIGVCAAVFGLFLN